MPWGALSGARWLPSIGNVFWGIGINSRVSGDHTIIIAENTSIYVQYTCIYVTYIHIRAYTIYVHMCPYKHIMLKYTYIYVHIRAYTISETVLDP